MQASLAAGLAAKWFTQVLRDGFALTTAGGGATFAGHRAGSAAAAGARPGPWAVAGGVRSS